MQSLHHHHFSRLDDHLLICVLCSSVCFLILFNVGYFFLLTFVPWRCYCERHAVMMKDYSPLSSIDFSTPLVGQWLNSLFPFERCKKITRLPLLICYLDVLNISLISIIICCMLTLMFCFSARLLVLSFIYIFCHSIKWCFYCQVGDLQHRKCGVVFDLSCNLARILEFCTHEIPQAFLLGLDMNLRRLTELIIFILNHIISVADSEFLDKWVSRPKNPAL